MSDSSQPEPDHVGRMVRTEVQTSVSSWLVWLAWTDQTHLSNWLLDSSDGELEVGKSSSWILSGRRHPVEFVVHRLEAERSFLAELNPSGQLIEVRVEGAAGRSLISITHSGFSDDHEGDADYEEAIAVWQQRVNVLKLYLSKYFARRRQGLWTSSLTSMSEAEIHRQIFDPATHGEWLTLEGNMVPAHTSMVQLWDESRIMGRVLVASSDFLMFSWDDGMGYVILSSRRLSSGHSEIGIEVASWLGDAVQLKALSETIRVALCRMLDFKGVLVSFPRPV